MFNLIFGKKKSSPISITVLGAYLQDGTCYEFVLIQCSHYGKGIYLYHGGEMVEKELQKPPFLMKMSAKLKKNPVSLLIGGKPRELDLDEAFLVMESLEGFTPILAFYNLKKELFEKGAKKTPKAKPEKKSPAIEVEATTLTE